VSVSLFAAELAAFATMVGAGPSKQVVLVLDRAGWHSTQRLRVPDFLHLLFLPAYSPELQPAEHLWPLTNTALVNRHFANIEELEDAQMQRCVALQDHPERIRSTTRFSWWP
jgi:transposase